MKILLKKGEEALVIAGADKGKRTKVLQVDLNNLKVRLQGVRIQTHFDKKEGIKKIEGWIDYSNVRRLTTQSATTKKAKTSKLKTAKDKAIK